MVIAVWRRSARQGPRDLAPAIGKTLPPGMMIEHPRPGGPQNAREAPAKPERATLEIYGKAPEGPRRGGGFGWPLGAAKRAANTMQGRSERSKRPKGAKPEPLLASVWGPSPWCRDGTQRALVFTPLAVGKSLREERAIARMWRKNLCVPKAFEGEQNTCKRGERARPKTRRRPGPGQGLAAVAR